MIGQHASTNRRQQRILEFIDRYTRRNGYAPTHSEITQATGVTNVSYHLDVLEAEGRIRRQRHVPRSVEVL